MVGKETVRRGIAVTLLVSITWLGPVRAEVSSANRPGEAVRYMVVVTGGELLSGVYADGHTYFLTRTLHPLGLHCVGSMSVDDKRVDLKEALRFATGRAPLIIVTGGLGPTDNDITREAISEFTGVPLREHPDLLQRMAKRFGGTADQLRANLRRQTQTPVRGSYLDNGSGTAAGLVFESAKTVIVALPGPPGELQPMVRDGLIPCLSKRFGTRLPGRSLTLRFVGLGQSEIDGRIKEHVTLAPDVTTGSQFAGGRVDFTFTLPNDTPREKQRLDALKREIVTYLGEYIYADDDTTLEQHVVALLRQRGATLVLAEVGSGGTMEAALSGADRAGDVVLGAYVAPTIERLGHLLSVRDARWADGVSAGDAVDRLADATAGAAANQWAIAIGERRDDGSVEVAFRRPSGEVQTERVSLRGTGELARSRFVTHLLDRFRRKIAQ